MLHEDFLTRHKQSDEGSVAVGGGAEPVYFDDTLQFCYTLIPPPPPSTYAGESVWWWGGQRDLSNLFLTRHQDVSAWPLQNYSRVNHVIGSKMYF